MSGTEERASELNNFHQVLSDISWGKASDIVEDFIVAAFVRGGTCGVAQNCEYDGSTAIFTKRRYRDSWNRVIVRRCAKEHNHSLKIKGRVRARGARGQHWYNDRRTELARKTSRTQALWYLHLAGDWSEAFETEASAIRPHMMRVMLVSNLALDQRFACVDGISEYPVNYFCQASIPPRRSSWARFGIRPMSRFELTPSTGTGHRDGFCAGTQRKPRHAKRYRVRTRSFSRVLSKRAP